MIVKIIQKFASMKHIIIYLSLLYILICASLYLYLKLYFPKNKNINVHYKLLIWDRCKAFGLTLISIQHKRLCLQHPYSNLIGCWKKLNNWNLENIVKMESAFFVQNFLLNGNQHLLYNQLFLLIVDMMEYFLLT